MSDPRDEWSYSTTPAELIRRGGLAPDLPFAAQAREILSAERRHLRAEYEARMDAADPTWRTRRALQEQLAARGWPGQVVEIAGPVYPPELAPLYAARAAATARQGLESPAGDDGVMTQFKGEVAQRVADARRRMNEGLPRGLEGM